MNVLTATTDISSKLLIKATFLILILTACSQNGSSTRKVQGVQAEPDQNHATLERSISVESLRSLLEEFPNTNIIDVRTQAEVETGKIRASALHFDVQQTGFDQDIQNLDKEAVYYVYCMAGTRSSKAQQRMEELGFTKVVNIDGGLKAWTAAGYPLEVIN